MLTTSKTTYVNLAVKSLCCNSFTFIVSVLELVVNITLKVSAVKLFSSKNIKPCVVTPSFDCAVSSGSKST